MTSALLNRFVRRLHLWLGIAISVQLGLWLISGLFMTLFPIDTVRGAHLRADVGPTALRIEQPVLSPSDILERSPGAETITLRTRGDQLVYSVRSGNDVAIRDAATGKTLSPLSQTEAEEIATAYYAGGGTVGDAVLFETDPPRQYGREGPVWRVDFDKPDAASFYVDATTGEVGSVRTGLWRTFDFMWGLHIMDWSSRENFNSWWIKATASVAVIFFLSGLCLVMLRLRSALRRRRNLSRVAK